MRFDRLLLAALLPALVAAGPVHAQSTAPPPPVPAAECGPGSVPEPGVQGRAPADDPKRTDGYRCNLELVGRFGTQGGYKVHRYVDKAGRECAYFDSTLLFPGSLYNGADLTGVYVLDMADPSKPVKTANLLTPAMESPHESLELNQARGLLVADMGYPTFNPGFVDIYDVSQDCRQPVLKSSTPLGVLGHESGFAPDGKTFYVSSTGGGVVTALDITDPVVPKILWVSRDYSAHGMRVSDDGNRLYIADTSDGLIILDVSEVQARKANPVVREVSRLTWNVISIPQVALPVRIGGHPYLVEIDEFARGVSSAPDAPVGAARIIDIGDETKPKIVSDIRLTVNNPEARAASADDPGTSSSLQGYTGHYCSVPQRDEPGIVACSFVASGLRVFDIRDPLAPKEIAYWNMPVEVSALEQPSGSPSNYAMSAPTFVPERGEIWYADGNSGFWALRFTNGVWPFAAVSAAGGSTGPASSAGLRGGGGAADPMPATGGVLWPLSLGGAALASTFLFVRRVSLRRR